MLGRFYNLLFPFLLCTSTAYACPQNGDLIDFNCDGQIKLVFTGDSIVAGKGDRRGSQGYVGRLAAALPGVSLENLGIGGMRAYQLVAAFRKRLAPDGTARMLEKSGHADFIMIDVGRNDYLGKKQPEQVIREIKRLVKYLRISVTQQNGITPFVAVATLLPVNRGRLRLFVRDVNHLLLKEKARGTLPVFVRFDRMSMSVISKDGLHPSPSGFQSITKVVEHFLKGPLQEQLKLLRPDTDGDGVYDMFEAQRYHTNPSASDSDGDSVSDGDEIFVFGTDPLSKPLVQIEAQPPVIYTPPREVPPVEEPFTGNPPEVPDGPPLVDTEQSPS